jgi:hypothetical protein
MKRIVLAALMLGVSAVAAHAESFTFTSAGQAAGPPVAGVGADGKPTASSHLTAVTDITYASGAKSTAQTKCASTAGSAGVSGQCDYTEANGDAASIAFTCMGAADGSQADCKGTMNGTAGARQGKTGTIMWHQTGTPDGKSAATGSGAWN